MSEDIQREEMECDVLIVGAGSAGLSCAISLHDQIENHNKQIQEGKIQGNIVEEPMIVVLEKGPEVGAHSFSGAVLDPVALHELIPDFKDKGCPIEADVNDEALYYLTQKSSIKSPFLPPPFHNKGNYVIKLSQFNRWLGQQAESRGINIFPGFAASEVLYDGEKVIGVRTGDKGLDKNGNRKGNFEPGMDLKAKVTIFAEGPRGSLVRKVIDKLNLREGRNPDGYSEGVKEVIQLPEGRVKPGMVIHTAGYPLKETTGGTFIYSCQNNQIIVGLVGYLSTHDPLFDPHRELQKLKTHPFMQKLLDGGEVIAYGGKVIPAGGWASQPKLYHDGMMIIGDSAGFVNDQRLKGIHLGMKSGILAATTALEALAKNDSSENILSAYKKRVDDSYIKKELYKVRNFHHTLNKGMFLSAPLIALQEITNGHGLFGDSKTEKDAKETEDVVDVWGPDRLDHPENQLPKPDGKLFFDKLSSVYLTKTQHDEDSPNHLKVADLSTCSDTCRDKYHSPCNHFCPANVYEMVPDENGGGKEKLVVNYTNCIHCKTCDIKCPYENITWTVPEGGGGPQYSET